MIILFLIREAQDLLRTGKYWLTEWRTRDVKKLSFLTYRDIYKLERAKIFRAGRDATGHLIWTQKELIAALENIEAYRIAQYEKAGLLSEDGR
jgi:hypothetical protein